MYESEDAWRDVDVYFADALFSEDQALTAARESGHRTTMPRAEVAPNQGKLPAMPCQIAGAGGSVIVIDNVVRNGDRPPDLLNFNTARLRRELLVRVLVLVV